MHASVLKNHVVTLEEMATTFEHDGAEGMAGIAALIRHAAGKALKVANGETIEFETAPGILEQSDVRDDEPSPPVEATQEG